MDLGIKGKRAIVTGGSSGIGFETARQFLDEGVRVLITGPRNFFTFCHNVGSTGRPYCPYCRSETSFSSITKDLTSNEARSNLIAQFGFQNRVRCYFDPR